MWLAEVKAKAKRKNQILFSKDSLLLADLCQLIAQANRRALILCALDLPAELGRLFEEIRNQPLPMQWEGFCNVTELVNGYMAVRHIGIYRSCTSFPLKCSISISNI